MVGYLPASSDDLTQTVLTVACQGVETDTGHGQGPQAAPEQDHRETGGFELPVENITDNIFVCLPPS